MSEYKIVRDEDDEIIPCECCGWKGETSQFQGVQSCGYPRDGEQPLCEICAMTFLSSPHTFPSLYSDADRHLAGGIAWIGNKILDEIRQSREIK